VPDVVLNLAPGQIWFWLSGGQGEAGTTIPTSAGTFLHRPSDEEEDRTADEIRAGMYSLDHQHPGHKGGWDLINCVNPEIDRLTKKGELEEWIEKVKAYHASLAEKENGNQNR
jgi:hypothetical protein